MSVWNLEEAFPNSEEYENASGILTGTFLASAILKFYYVFVQKIIIATAVLENIARQWGEEGFEEEEDDDNSEDDDQEEGNVVQDVTSDESVRLRGQVQRDRLLAGMRD